MRNAATEESIEYRKASVATPFLSTPFNYVEDPNQTFYESTPLRPESFSPLIPHSSPLPQRRASSIRSSSQYSPMYAEPQYFEQSMEVPGIPAPPPVNELAASINEDSVKMLK